MGVSGRESFSKAASLKLVKGESEYRRELDVKYLNGLKEVLPEPEVLLLRAKLTAGAIQRSVRGLSARKREPLEDCQQERKRIRRSANDEAPMAKAMAHTNAG